MLPRLFLVMGALTGWALFVALAWKPILAWCADAALYLAGDGLIFLPAYDHMMFVVWVIIMLSPGMLVGQAFSWRSTPDRRAEQLARDWS